MKQIVFVKKGIIDWEEVPDPEITGPGEVLVRPLAVARCDLDLGIIQGETLFRPPFPIGHEFVGEITQVSPDLEGEFSPGKRVAVSFQISCGTCPHCQTGDSKSCSTLPPVTSFGMAPGAKTFGGALADLVRVPYAKQMLLPLKEDTDPVSVASLSDNISEAWKLAGRFLEVDPSLSVLVLGGLASSIGLYTALLASKMGKGIVKYVDTDKQRVDHATRLGIDAEWVNVIPKSFGKFDLVCEAAFSKEAWESGLRSLKSKGKFSSASIYWTNRLEIPYLELYNVGAELHLTRVDSREYMEKLLGLIESGIYDPGPIVTKTASFRDAKEAWMEPSTKLVINDFR